MGSAGPAATAAAASLRLLATSHPAIAIALLKNMLRSAHEIVNRLSREVSALSG
jgi:hypothetical protein